MVLNEVEQVLQVFENCRIRRFYDAYEIIPSAFYKGFDFGIIGFDKESQEATLMTSNPEAWRKLNLETHAKYEFTVCVSIIDLDIIEEKVTILGF